MKKHVFSIVILVFFYSCNSQDDFIQDVYVNETISLNLPEYSELLSPGSSIFIKGGVDGLIVYRGVGENYKVYDRNCSYEPNLECSYIDSINSTIAMCGCCSSAFLLDQNGVAANSPAVLPLKQYNYSLNNTLLHIFN